MEDGRGNKTDLRSSLFRSWWVFMGLLTASVLGNQGKKQAKDVSYPDHDCLM